MKKKIKHAVVIVNYNGWQDTLVCLRSISKTKDKPYVIVVDNGSTDESIEKIKTGFPGVDLIATGSNLGFSGGNNVGIKKALRKGAQVVYLLNNDTEVDANLFYRSYRYVAGKKKIASGKIYYAKGFEYHEVQRNKGNILWYAGGFIDWKNVVAQHLGVDEVDTGKYDEVKPVEFLTGCFMAIPRQAFSRIGLLSEPYFLYLEDVDYSLRALQAGYELVYNPNLVLYHRNGGTAGAGSPLVDYYMTRNRLLIGKKFGTFRLRLALLREALTRNWSNPVRRLAFLDFVFGRLGNRNQVVAQKTK